MGYIKEPPGVDFVINSGPLSPKDAALISAYIKADKAKRWSKQSRNAAYLQKIDRSMQQLREGKVVVKTMEELEMMAQFTELQNISLEKIWNDPKEDEAWAML